MKTLQVSRTLALPLNQSKSTRTSADLNRESSTRLHGSIPLALKTLNKPQSLSLRDTRRAVEHSTIHGAA